MDILVNRFIELERRRKQLEAMLKQSKLLSQELSTTTSNIELEEINNQLNVVEMALGGKSTAETFANKFEQAELLRETISPSWHSSIEKSEYPQINLNQLDIDLTKISHLDIDANKLAEELERVQAHDMPDNNLLELHIPHHLTGIFPDKFKTYNELEALSPNIIDGDYIQELLHQKSITQEHLNNVAASITTPYIDPYTPEKTLGGLTNMISIGDALKQHPPYSPEVYDVVHSALGGVHDYLLSEDSFSMQELAKAMEASELGASLLNFPPPAFGEALVNTGLAIPGYFDATTFAIKQEVSRLAPVANLHAYELIFFTTGEYRWFIDQTLRRKHGDKWSNDFIQRDKRMATTFAKKRQNNNELNINASEFHECADLFHLAKALENYKDNDTFLQIFNGDVQKGADTALCINTIRHACMHCIELPHPLIATLCIYIKQALGAIDSYSIIEERFERISKRYPHTN